MKARAHAAASIFTGTLVSVYTKSLYAGILCFISGFLIDLDHIIDYIICHGLKGFTIKRFFLACEQTEKMEGEERFKKLILFLHAYEFMLLVCVAAALTKNLYLLSIAIGYSLHMLMDSTKNALYPYAYSIVWRGIKHFDAEKLVRREGNNI